MRQLWKRTAVGSQRAAGRHGGAAPQREGFYILHAFACACAGFGEPWVAVVFFVCVRRARASPMGEEATPLGGLPSARDIELLEELYHYIDQPAGSRGAGFEPTTPHISSIFHTHAGTGQPGDNSDRGFLIANPQTPIL